MLSLCSKYFWFSQFFTAAGTTVQTCSFSRCFTVFLLNLLILTVFYCFPFLSAHTCSFSQCFTVFHFSLHKPAHSHSALLFSVSLCTNLLILTVLYCFPFLSAASTPSRAPKALLQQAQVLVLTELYCSKHKFCSHRALLQQAQVLFS